MQLCCWGAAAEMLLCVRRAEGTVDRGQIRRIIYTFTDQRWAGTPGTARYQTGRPRRGRVMKAGASSPGYRCSTASGAPEGRRPASPNLSVPLEIAASACLPADDDARRRCRAFGNNAARTPPVLPAFAVGAQPAWYS